MPTEQGRVVRVVGRINPAAPPILAMSSARLFSFSCKGVGSGSPRRAAGWATWIDCLRIILIVSAVESLVPLASGLLSSRDIETGSVVGTGSSFGATAEAAMTVAMFVGVWYRGNSAMALPTDRRHLLSWEILSLSQQLQQPRIPLSCTI